MRFSPKDEDEIIAILRWKSRRPSNFKNRWMSLKKIGQFINRSHNYVGTRVKTLESIIFLERS
jgi:hypothetical protein